MVKILFIIILVFLYYLICVCLYILYKNHKSKRISEKLDVFNRETYEIIQAEIKNLKEKNLNNKNLSKLKKNFKNKDYQKHIIKYLLNKENKDEIIEFMNETKLIHLVFNRKEKDEFDKSYNIYIIGEFNIQNQYKYLIDNIDTDSVYIQINILKSLSKLGNKIHFIDGLKKTINSSSLIHEKVLIDVIYTFYKNNKDFNDYLEKELKNNNIEFNKIIINHFINTKYEGAKDNIYCLLEDCETDKEIKIACIKYFSNIKHFKVKDILIKLLKDENWEIRAISANALKQYKYKDVIISLQESIKDGVWYVRQNSAQSLYNLVKEKEDLKLIINGEDKYASDSIKSIYSEENIDEYIVDIKNECAVNIG